MTPNGHAIEFEFQAVVDSPPDTLLVSGPGAATNDNTPDITYTGTDDLTAPAALTYEYRKQLNAGGYDAYVAAPSGAVNNTLTLPVLADGAWDIQIRAIDSIAQVDPTPLTVSFEVDTVAPGAVTGLATANPTFTTLEIGWSETGDDAGVGTAASRDLRFRTDVPVTALNFGTSTPVVDAQPGMSVAGTGKNMTHTGLLSGTTYYYGMIVVDNATNQGALATASGTTLSPDVTAPGGVTGLAARNPTNTTVDLSWYETGDDGSSGTADSRELRWRTGGPVTGANFAAATPIVTAQPAMAVAGTKVSMVATDLPMDTLMWIGGRVLDEAGNPGPVVSSDFVQTLSPTAGGSAANRAGRPARGGPR